jgi:hypothetical protein
MATNNGVSNNLKDFFSRYYKILIIIFSIILILLIILYFSFNTIFARVGKPTHIGSIQGTNQTVLFYFDKFQETTYKRQDTYQLVGWAFPKDLNRPLADYHKQIVLINDQSLAYYFDTEVMIRKDVTKAFSDLGIDLDQSGYSVNISKKYLPEGKYNIALLFSLSDGSESILFRTNSYLNRIADDLQLIKEK